MADFEQHFRRAKEAGLKVTLHIAEVGGPRAGRQDADRRAMQVAECPAEETLLLLSFKPDRLGHATFLDEAAKKIAHTEEIPIELCLSSNLITKTVPTLDAHHIRYYLGHNHPIAICVSRHPGAAASGCVRAQCRVCHRRTISCPSATHCWANMRSSWRSHPWALV